MITYKCLRCNASQTFMQHSRSEYCDKPDCQRAKAQSFLERQKQQLLEQLTALCKPTLSNSKKLAQVAAKIIPVVAIVPANRNTLMASSTVRREAFLQHLSDVFDDVEKGNKPTDGVYTAKLFPEYDAHETELLGKACATCQGHCCRLGEDHAFQDYSSLKFFLEARENTISKQQLLELYADEFPQQSYSGGCVFQGEKGCTLNREMRSFTCNNYQCEGLGNYHASIRQSDSSLSFVAAVEKEEIHYASVFTSEDFLRVK